MYIETTRLSFSKHKSIWAAFTFRVIQLYIYIYIYILYETALLLEKINETNQDCICKKYPGTPTI